MVQEKLDWLYQTWVELVSSYGEYPEDADPWFGNIVDAYTGVGRVYHTEVHLYDILQNVHFLAINTDLQDCRWIEWAAFFHDYIYIPGAENNEESSCEVAEKALLNLGFGTWTSKGVNDLIMTTKTQKTINTMGRLLCDADNMILASSRDNYERYARLIRLEYHMFTDEQWALGRDTFLRKCLSKPIFHSPQARSACETRARENIIWEMASLKKLVRS